MVKKHGVEGKNLEKAGRLSVSVHFVVNACCRQNRCGGMGIHSFPQYVAHAFPGDMVWYEKYTYGAVLPEKISELPVVGLLCVFPFMRELDARIGWGKYRLAGIRKPERMDVVVFDSPADTGMMMVKRCIGLPGDTLLIRRGRIYINGRKVTGKDRDLFYKKSVPVSFSKAMEDRWTTTGYGPFIIPYKGMILSKDKFSLYAETMEREGGSCMGDSIFVFTEDYYFMLGDNGDNSLDSRFIGLIPYKYIRGRVTRVLYSRITSLKERCFEPIW